MNPFKAASSVSSMPVCVTSLFEVEGGIPLVSVSGEIDICTVDELSILLLRAVAEAGRAGTVIVDLGETEFMDGSGARALMGAQNVLEDSSGSLAVVCRGTVRCVLDLLGLAECLDLYPDLYSAVAAAEMDYSVDPVDAIRALGE